jgi:hypothetical protein
MKPIGSDGVPIPTPPEPTPPWPTRAVSYLVQSLTFAALFLVAVLVRIAFDYKAALSDGWVEFARRMALVLGLSLLMGFALPALYALCTLVCRPWSRRSAGKKLEQQVASLGLDQLDEEIEHARAAVREVADGSQRDGWAAWLAWLETKRRARAARAPFAPPGEAVRNWTIRPAIGPQVLLACIGAPFIALAVAAVVSEWGHVSWIGWASAVVLLCLGGWCMGEVSSVRIRLTPDCLKLRRWWLTRWSVPRERAELREGLIGDGNLVPGYRVLDRSTGAKVGEIVAVQFRRADLLKLAAMFAPPRPLTGG